MADCLPIQVMETSRSMGATFNGNAVSVARASSFSVQPVWSGGGAPAGTLKLQYSNDNTNWDDISGQTFAVAADGNKMFTVNNVNYNFVRLVYTRTGGTGTLNATLAPRL